MLQSAPPQAIVLAAGFGRRMKPLTDTCHKALLPVGGTTILSRIVESLLDVGVRDTTVVTGYRANDVRHYLEQRYSDAMTFHFVHNERYASTNNIVSLSLAFDQVPLDRDVLLVECDLLFHPSLLKRVVARSGNVALVDRYRTGMDGTVVAVADGAVTHVYPPHVQGEDFEYSDKFKTLNIYRFDRDFCQLTLRPLLNVYANQIDPNCYYELVLGMLTNISAQPIAAEVVDGELWAEVDDPNDLAVARFRFEPEQRADILDHTMGGEWGFGVRDFAYIRNVHFPTPSMLAALRHALPELLAGYGSSQGVLNEKLGLVLGCAPARLQVLHGATQAFPIMRELLGPLRAAIPAPTFGEFRATFSKAVSYADRPGIQPGELDRLAGCVDVLVVVNPNNPTGTLVSSGWLHDVARRHPSTLMIVDESFIGFSQEPPMLACLERESLPNVVVLASLSKTLGVPGLRLGYLYACDRSLVCAVGERLPIWNLSAMAEYFLELVLKFRLELARSIAQTVSDREALAAMLRDLPAVAEVYPSAANFLLVRLEGPPGLAGRLRRRLLAEASVDVKDVSSRFADGLPRLRVGVRTRAENAEFAARLGATVARLAA